MDTIKLQKYVAESGLMSRRAAEKEIEKGCFKINGEVAELGARVAPDVDEITYKNSPIKQAEKKLYILLNKPRGYVTTASDEKGRKTVLDLVRVPARVYPVGRLDLDSDGLILLTNDGDLTQKLTHPRHNIPKIYHVTVRGAVSKDALATLRSPLTIDGYKIKPVQVTVIDKSDGSTTLKFTLFEGRNRQIRHMCEQAGLAISRLCRVALGEIDIEGLQVGKWRYLTRDELEYLKASTDEPTTKNSNKGRTKNA